MKIIVIGGTGLIGSKLVAILKQRGHEAIAASPNTGVNTMTGEGVAAALAGADIVVDVANSPSFADDAVMEFFTTTGRNLLGAAKTAGVKHHVALSVVGTDRLPASAYFRGKSAQEALIRESGLPYTIVHSTQFFEFLGGIAGSAGEGDTLRLPSANIQAISSDDVALAMADYTLGAPQNGVVEIGGPERVRMADLVQHYLQAKGDARKVVADPHAPYFGAVLEENSLVPGANARLGTVKVDDWLKTQAAR